jgi:Cdc6-like AAA superfamily ATPase
MECIPGTGIWLLKSRGYTKWKTQSPTFLWLYGIPGCGKTVLSSTIIEDVRHQSHHPDVAVVYFYFDFRDSQKQISEQMVKSLVTQLFRICTETSPAMMSFFALLEKAQHPSIGTLLATLQQVIHELPETYIVVDALDECNDRHELMDVIQKMARWQQEKLHILVTSRKEPDIESLLETLTDENSAVDLRARLVDQDIEAYVNHRLSVDKALQKWGKDTKLRQEITMVLMQKARGM